MTVSDRFPYGPALRSGAVRAAETFPRAGKPEPAPALYRLLSDSALSRAALSACGLPLALTDARSPLHPLTYANPAFEAFFGYRAGDALGEQLERLLPSAQDATGVLCGEAPARAQAVARRKDGTRVAIELAIGPLRDADGCLTHWVLAVNDCTELQALREELSALRAHAAAGEGAG